MLSVSSAYIKSSPSYMSEPPLKNGGDPFKKVLWYEGFGMVWYDKIGCAMASHSMACYAMLLSGMEGYLSVWFKGELFIRTLSTTFIETFCEFMLHSKVIFKSMTGPDDTGHVDLKS